MKCQDVHSLMGPFIDEEVPLDVVALMNTHLIDCPDCEEERASIAAIRSSVRKYAGKIEPSADFMERLRESVRKRGAISKRQARLKRWHQALPFGAVAAAVICCLMPQQPQVLNLRKTVSVIEPKSLSAHALYTYERKIRRRATRRGFGLELAHGATQFKEKPPSFQGWRLVQICCVEINSVKAINYIYTQANTGSKIQTMSCYQLPGGVFDDTALSHHNIDGRSICCGTQNGVSLVSWTAGKTDFVLASQLSRADLLDIALQS